MQWQPSQQPAPMYSMSQQQAYPSYDNAGQQWQNPQHAYQNNATQQSYQNNAPQQSYQSQPQQSSSVVPNTSSETRTISGEADGVRYTILYRGGHAMHCAACRAASPRFRNACIKAELRSACFNVADCSQSWVMLQHICKHAQPPEAHDTANCVQQALAALPTAEYHLLLKVFADVQM